MSTTVQNITQAPVARRGPSILLIVVFLLAVAKVFGFIAASWWLILLPLWLPLAVSFVLFGIASAINFFSERKREKERAARREAATLRSTQLVNGRIIAQRIRLDTGALRLGGDYA